MKTTKKEPVFYPHFTKWRVIHKEYFQKFLNSIINP